MSATGGRDINLAFINTVAVRPREVTRGGGAYGRVAWLLRLNDEQTVGEIIP